MIESQAFLPQAQESMTKFAFKPMYGDRVVRKLFRRSTLPHEWPRNYTRRIVCFRAFTQ